MYIGEFIQTFETTRETVRYYIEEGLLTPTKVNGKYFFEDIDLILKTFENYATWDYRFEC